MNGLLVFGILFLLMTLIVGRIFKKDLVEDPTCPQVNKNVKNNKKYYKIFLIVSTVMILLGLLLMII